MKILLLIVLTLRRAFSWREEGAGRGGSRERKEQGEGIGKNGGEGRCVTPYMSGFARGFLDFKDVSQVKLV